MELDSIIVIYLQRDKKRGRTKNTVFGYTV